MITTVRRLVTGPARAWVRTSMAHARDIPHNWKLRKEQRGEAEFERALGRLLDKVLRPDSNCVDIGAHTGAVTS